MFKFLINFRFFFFVKDITLTHECTASLRCFLFVTNDLNEVLSVYNNGHYNIILKLKDSNYNKTVRMYKLNNFED